METKKNITKIGLLILLLFFLSINMASISFEYPQGEEYVITLEGQKVRFIARPELGYVVKILQEQNPNNYAKVQTDNSNLLLPENAMPIGGIGRRGVWVIENKSPAAQVQNTRKLFSNQSQYQYIAPLFSCNDETVAIIPEIVVRVKPEIQVEQVQSLCEKIGCSIIKPMEFTTQEYLLQVLGHEAEGVFKVAEQLNAVDSVEWAVPNIAVQSELAGQPELASSDFGSQSLLSAANTDANSPGVFPNDEYFLNQWHVYNIGQTGGTPGADIRTPEAWKITKGDPNIVVAVLDTGVDSKHSDLADNLVPGYDFIDSDDISDPALNHPLNCQGTLCVDNITSLCIDTGDPNSPVGNEPEPNGNRINMGAYGGTSQASKIQ